MHQVYCLNKISTEYPDWFPHGGFDVEGTDILPTFLCEGDQEVNGHCDVLSEIFFRLFHMSDASAQTGCFFGLEFYCVFDFFNFVN